MTSSLFSSSSKYLVLFCYYFCSTFVVLQLQVAATQPESPPDSANAINSDLVEHMSWKCANNASCLYAIANSVMDSYRSGETIQFGLFDLEKLPPAPPAKNGSDFDAGFDSISGRGLNSGFVEFLRGNAIRVPIGPMVFRVQRAEDDGNYIEVALLKKAPAEARLEGEAGRHGDSEDGGHSHKKRNRRRKQNDKKQFQMFIPLYLAASTFGWTMVAVKAVGLLTLKALAVSKLALVLATVVIVKKLLDNASEKMMYQYPEHTPYVMPYSMDYGGLQPMAAPEMPTGDMYPMQMPVAPPMHPAHTGPENMAADSNLHHHVTELHNNTQMFAALTAAGLAGQMQQHQPHQQHPLLPLQKVKREDSWLASQRKRFTLRGRHGPYGPMSYAPLKGKTHLSPNRWLPASAYSSGSALALVAAAEVVEAEEAEDDMFADK